MIRPTLNGVEREVIINGKVHELVFGVTYHPYYQLLLDYASTNGIAHPPYNVRVAGSELMGTLVNLGIWQMADVLSVFAYGSSSLSRFAMLDWKRVVEYSLHGGAVLMNNGLRGNGINGYVDLKYNPATDAVNYQQNNAGRLGIVYAGSNWIDGNTSTTNRFHPGYSTEHRVNNTGSLSSQAFYQTTVNVERTGAKYIGRNHPTNVYLYDKWGEYFRTTPSSIAPSNLPHNLLRSGSQHSNVGLSFYFMGGFLDKTQLDGTVDAVAEYLQDTGLNPSYLFI